jgi:hypothetical protein
VKWLNCAKARRFMCSCQGGWGTPNVGLVVAAVGNAGRGAPAPANGIPKLPMPAAKSLGLNIPKVDPTWRRAGNGSEHGGGSRRLRGGRSLIGSSNSLAGTTARRAVAASAMGAAAMAMVDCVVAAVAAKDAIARNKIGNKQNLGRVSSRQIAVKFMTICGDCDVDGCESRHRFWRFYPGFEILSRLWVTYLLSPADTRPTLAICI